MCTKKLKSSFGNPPVSDGRKINISVSIGTPEVFTMEAPASHVPYFLIFRTLLFRGNLMEIKKLGIVCRPDVDFLTLSNT